MVSGCPRGSAGERVHVRDRPASKRPRNHGDEWRDDGNAEGVSGLHRCLVAAGLQLSMWLHRRRMPRRISRWSSAVVSWYACVGVQSHSIVSRTPMALVPNPVTSRTTQTIKTVRDPRSSARAGMFIALLNHPKVKDRSIDFSSIRASFRSRTLWRRPRRSSRSSPAARTGRLLAHGSNDGVYRDPAERRQQGGIGRRAASRRGSLDRGCRDRHAIPPAGETGESSSAAPQGWPGISTILKKQRARCGFIRRRRRVRRHGTWLPHGDSVLERRLLPVHRRSSEGSHKTSGYQVCLARWRKCLRSPLRAGSGSGWRPR